MGDLGMRRKRKRARAKRCETCSVVGSKSHRETRAERRAQESEWHAPEIDLVDEGLRSAVLDAETERVADGLGLALLELEAEGIVERETHGEEELETDGVGDLEAVDVV